MAAPQYLSSLSMQATCNLVLYQTSTAIWSSGTDEGLSGGVGVGEVPGNSYADCYATMQTTGNLVMYAPSYPGARRPSGRQILDPDQVTTVQSGGHRPVLGDPDRPRHTSGPLRLDYPRHNPGRSIARIEEDSARHP